MAIRSTSLTALVLTSVLGASADGTVLAGTAQDAQGGGHVFWLRVPAALVN